MALLHNMALIFKTQNPFFAYALPSICLCSSSKNSSPRSLSPYLSLSLNSRLKSLASWHYDYNNFECNGFDICTQNTPHTVKKQRTMHTLLLLYFAQHTTPPPQTTIHILNLSYEIMYSNNEQYCILYLKQWYNYVYLFNRYLLQSENTSKLYSSLHTKQKNSSLDFFTSNYVQSSFNNSPISSNLFKFHPNNLEFPKRDIGTHKNLRSFFSSFISCCAGAYAGEAAAAALSGSWKSRDFFIGSFSHSAVHTTNRQPDFRHIRRQQAAVVTSTELRAKQQQHRQHITHKLKNKWQKC